MFPDAEIAVAGVHALLTTIRQTKMSLHIQQCRNGTPAMVWPICQLVEFVAVRAFDDINRRCPGHGLCPAGDATCQISRR
jgi:hypothetical protein